MKGKMNAVDWLALVLLIIGGLNWGLVGIFDFDLVAYVFGTFSTLSRIIYVIVGLAAVYIAIAIPAKSGVQVPTTSEPQKPATSR